MNLTWAIDWYSFYSINGVILFHSIIVFSNFPHQIVPWNTWGYIRVFQPSSKYLKFVKSYIKKKPILLAKDPKCHNLLIFSVGYKESLRIAEWYNLTKVIPPYHMWALSCVMLLTHASISSFSQTLFNFLKLIFLYKRC